MHHIIRLLWKTSQLNATAIWWSSSTGVCPGLRRQLSRMIRLFRTLPQTLPWENYTQQLSFCVSIAWVCKAWKKMAIQRMLQCQVCGSWSEGREKRVCGLENFPWCRGLKPTSPQTPRWRSGQLFASVQTPVSCTVVFWDIRMPHLPSTQHILNSICLLNFRAKDIGCICETWSNGCKSQLYVSSL